MKNLYETVQQPLEAAVRQYVYFRLLEELNKDYDNSDDKKFANEVLTRCILDYVQEEYAGWVYEDGTMKPGHNIDVESCLENKFKPSIIFPDFEQIKNLVESHDLLQQSDKVYTDTIKYYKF